MAIGWCVNSVAENRKSTVSVAKYSSVPIMRMYFKLVNIQVCILSKGEKNTFNFGEYYRCKIAQRNLNSFLHKRLSENHKLPA